MYYKMINTKKPNLFAPMLVPITDATVIESAETQEIIEFILNKNTRAKDKDDLLRNHSIIIENDILFVCSKVDHDRLSSIHLRTLTRLTSEPELKKNLMNPVYISIDELVPTALSVD